MKKSKKIFLRVLPILIVAVMLVANFSFVGAAAKSSSSSSSEPVNSNNLGSLAGNQTGSGTMNTAVQKMWASVLLILQILAVAAIVFAGVRYMFASADEKADIKKQMIILVIGAVLVFAASTIISIIVNVTNDIAG